MYYVMDFVLFFYNEVHVMLMLVAHLFFKKVNCYCNWQLAPESGHTIWHQLTLRQ